MFTGSEGDEISLETATSWTANFRENHPNATKAYFFGNDLLEQVMAQTGCVGLRFYNAIDEDGGTHLVVVGVDEEENDLYNGILAERALPCPPYSDSNSPLCE